MGISVINSLPSSISPIDHAELTQSTPSTFTSIPPVLRLLIDNVIVKFKPSFADGHINNVTENKCTLMVTDSEVSVYCQSTMNGFSVDYPTIILFAVSNNDKCIYCQLDERQTVSDKDEEFESREMYIYPSEQDEESLNKIYKAISDCSSLHPNKFGEEDSDIEEDNDRFDDVGGMPNEIDEEEQDLRLSERGLKNMERFEDMLEGQVEDPKDQENKQDEHVDKKQKN